MSEPNLNKNNQIIEEDKQFSQSLIWQLQRNFFSQQGADAWRNAIVPHYITSNPFIARAYAKVMIGWLRDIADMLDTSQPVYIVELGAGSGRLAYHFLKFFFGYIEKSNLRDIPITYVMSDYAQSTLDFWKDQHQLQAWVQSGKLDFALYDAENDETLHLMNQDVHLTPHTLKNPLGFIANYFFDGLTKDVFLIEDNILYESLVTLSVPDSNPDLDDPNLLSKLDMTYEYYETTPDYYVDDDFNTLLGDYAQTLQYTHLLFPIGSLDCIKQLLQLSNGNMFVLTGDKGYHHELDLERRGQPLVKIHGSFSMMVNYHALGRYVQQQGGHFLSTPHRQASLDICGMLFGSVVDKPTETQLAYEQEIIDISPDDFFTAQKVFGTDFTNFTLNLFLAHLRLSGWDSKVLLEYYPHLLTLLDDITPSHREEVIKAVTHVWDSYYFIGEPEDLSFAISSILFILNYHDEAIDYLKQSLTLYGKHATTLCNLAMCYYEIDELQTALDYVNQSLTIDPRFKKARDLHTQLKKEMEI